MGISSISHYMKIKKQKQLRQIVVETRKVLGKDLLPLSLLLHLYEFSESLTLCRQCVFKIQ